MSRIDRGAVRAWGGIAVIVLVAVVATGGAVGVASQADGERIDPAWRLPPAHDGPPLVALDGEQGEFVAECPFSHRAPDDPIVFPGRPGRSHSHDFFGNLETDADSTAASLRGGRTTCHNGADTAAYWAPTLYRDGEAVDPDSASAYYRGPVGADVTRLVPPPPGLAMIGGDAGATSAQSTDVVDWACGARGQSRQEPPACPERSPLTLRVHFPDCWDGERLDSADHVGHTAYSVSGTCPTTHPVAMSRLVLVVHYPIHGPTGDLHFASGDLATAHADFLNAWDQEELASETRSCVNRRVTCTV